MKEEIGISLTQSFRPYYSPSELTTLIRLQSRAKQQDQPSDPSKPPKELSQNKIQAWRQLACGFIDRVGQRLGFPRRTIATAQNLYHRFHLMYPFRDFVYHDVSLAAILVSSKLEDTLKKLREIQIAGFQILNMIEGGNGTAEGDPAAQEAHRPNLIAIERLILQTICFNFNLHRTPFIILPSSDASSPNGASLLTLPSVPSKDLFLYSLRFCLSFSASKSYTYLSHLIAIDSSRTLVALSYPTHTIAISCVYLASFFWKEHLNFVEWKEGEEVTMEVREREPKFEDKWWEDFESDIEDIENIMHTIVDLFMQLCPPSASPSATSSFAPSSTPGGPFHPSPLFSPHPNPSPVDPSPRAVVLTEKDKHLHQTGIPYTLLHTRGQVAGAEDLMKIKIRLREVFAGKSGEDEVGKKRKRGEERWGKEAEEGVKEEDRRKKYVSVRYRF